VGQRVKTANSQRHGGETKSGTRTSGWTLGKKAGRKLRLTSKKGRKTKREEREDQRECNYEGCAHPLGQKEQKKDDVRKLTPSSQWGMNHKRGEPLEKKGGSLRGSRGRPLPEPWKPFTPGKGNGQKPFGEGSGGEEKIQRDDACPVGTCGAVEFQPA